MQQILLCVVAGVMAMVCYTCDVASTWLKRILSLQDCKLQDCAVSCKTPAPCETCNAVLLQVSVKRSATN